MKYKVGDNVKVIAGDQKGSSGKIIKIFIFQIFLMLLKKVMQHELDIKLKKEKKLE